MDNFLSREMQHFSKLAGKLILRETCRNRRLFTIRLSNWLSNAAMHVSLIAWGADLLSLYVYSGTCDHFHFKQAEERNDLKYKKRHKEK